MKVHYAQRDVEAVNVAETAEFTMAANGKAFRIVIDGLYSDKIRAVIREIWSNAFDAHIAAGCPDRPFHCTLPSRFNETFSVRDFGVGMDHNMIMKLYSRVFESTKDGDDIQVGKFGLGSKSPFAYTDTFAVSAYDGKTVRMYSAYIGENGIPRISLMGTADSKEERGIEVSFPVLEKDRSAFVRAAEFTLMGFDTPPKLFGSSEVRIPDLTPILEGTGWKVIKNAGASPGAKVRQGCVVYPLDVSAVTGLDDLSRNCADLNLLLDFNIGDLEITPSRESLGYDEKTQNNIRARLKTISEEFVKNIQDAVAKAPTMYDAYKISREALDRSRAYHIYSLSDNIRRRLKWKGKPLCDTVTVHKSDFGKRTTHSYEEGGIRFCVFHASDLNRGVPGRGYGSRKTVLSFEETGSASLHLANTYVIVDYVNKNTTMAKNRIRYWWDTKVTGLNYNNHNVLWVKVNEKSSALARLQVLMDRFKHCKVIYLHDLDKPPVDPTATVRSKVQFSVVDGNGVNKATVDLADDHVYIECVRGVYKRPSGWTKQLYDSDIATIRTKLVSLGLLKSDQKVLVVPKTYEKVVDKHSDHWTSLFDLADKAVATHYSDAEYTDYINSYEILRQCRGDVFRSLVSAVSTSDVEISNETSYGGIIYRLITKAVSKQRESSKVIQAADIKAYKDAWTPPKPQLSNFALSMYSKVDEKLVLNYPMLGSLRGQYVVNDPKVKDGILEYINLKDAADRADQPANPSEKED